MLTGLETGLGLDIVVWVQATSNPVLDALAWALHILGAPAMYAILALLWFLVWSRRRAPSPNLPQSSAAGGEVATRYDRRETIYLWLFTLVMTILFTDALKLLFQAPRPYQVAPELVRLLIVQRSSYGLPSGHVSAAMAMSGLAAVLVGRRWMWIAAAAYILLVGWSRLYAGVHYPQDVAGGVVVGLVALWFSLRYFERFLRVWRHSPWPVRLALVIAGVALAANVVGA